MTRKMFMFCTLALSVMFAGIGYAHDDFRVVGTVTKASATQVDVKNKEGKKFSIKMNKQTAVTRDKDKVAASELKTGTNVVVDARGDSEDDLTAVGIRIVPEK